MKTTIIIPAYNEEASIGKLLEKVLALPFEKQVIVVDDGSTDDTFFEIDNAIAFEDDCTLLYHEENQGKGASIRTALEYATGDIVLICDADLELRPENINVIVAQFEYGNTGHCDVCYGTRFQKGYWHHRVHFVSKLCNFLLAKFVNLLWPHAHITDEATAYKAFRTDLLKSFDLKEDRFGFCPEVTAKVLNRGITIHEVPISYAPRSRADGKKVTWRDGTWAFWVLLREKIKGANNA